MIHQLKSKLMRRCRIPAYLSALYIALTCAASAAGILDTSDMSTEAAALLTFFMLIGAVAAVVAIIFAALSIKGRNIGEGLMGVLCAIAAIFIIGHATGWVSSITGVSVGGG